MSDRRRQTEEIIEKYGRYILGVIRYLMPGEPLEAQEDVYQDVCLRIYRALDSFENRSKLSTYLYVVARNAVFTYHTRKKKEKTISTEELPPGEPLRAPESDPVDSLALKIAFDKLDEEERIILLLKYTLDYSYKQIGDEFGLNEDQVKFKLLKARKRLKFLVSEYHEG